jgi:hypothetical protein
MPRLRGHQGPHSKQQITRKNGQPDDSGSHPETYGQGQEQGSFHNQR